MVRYGQALVETIKAGQPSRKPFEVVRQTVLSVAQQEVNHPSTRQIIDISKRSASAMQAHMSRMLEVEDRVAAAFAERLGVSSKDELQPRLIANLTVSTMNVERMS